MTESVESDCAHLRLRHEIGELAPAEVIHMEGLSESGAGLLREYEPVISI